MATYINTLLNTAGGDFARQTKFRAIFSIPTELSGNVQERDLDLLCKNFIIPARKMETIEYKYRGKTVPVMGPVTFEHNINVTFLLDDAHKIRTVFENWLIALDPHINSNDNKDITKYKKAIPLNTERTSQLVLSPLNWHEDIELNKYTFSGAFPVNVGEVAYSSDSVSSVQELTVEFAFLFFENESGGSDILSTVTGAINNGLQDAKEFLSTSAQALINGDDEPTKKERYSNRFNSNIGSVGDVNK